MKPSVSHRIQILFLLFLGYLLVAYQNVNPSQITSEGLGPSQPMADNATEAGRALNRRVEIAVQTGE